MTPSVNELLQQDWSNLIDTETGMLTYKGRSNSQLWKDEPRIKGLIEYNTAYLLHRELVEKGEGTKEPKFYYLTKESEKQYAKGKLESCSNFVAYKPALLTNSIFLTTFYSLLNNWAESLIRSLLILQGKGVEIMFAQQRCICRADVDIIRPFPEDLYYKWCARNMNPMDDDYLDPIQEPKEGAEGVYLIHWGSPTALLNLAYAYSECTRVQAYTLRGDGKQTRREWVKGNNSAERRRAMQVEDWIRSNDIKGLC